MKTKLIVGLSALVLLVGCVSAQPTAPERMSYDLRTNWLVVIGPATNAIGQVQMVTNIVPDVQLVPRQSIQSVIQTTGGMFGPWGVAVATLLGALYAGWAEFRNSRKSKVSAALAQGLEVAREVIKSLPSGTKTEPIFVASLKNQQDNAGVRDDVKAITQSPKVDTSDAKAEAKDIAVEVSKAQ